MKTLFQALFIILSIIMISCNSIEIIEESTDHKTDQVYDSLKAMEYGADEYGMKKYVMAFLYRGPNRDLDQDSTMKLQMAHLENIGKMAEEGKLVLAGPFLGDQDLRGIYIFNVSSIEEAKTLTNSDPAIQVGSLKMELFEWYGSAALIGVNKVHHTLAKKGVVEE